MASSRRAPGHTAPATISTVQLIQDCREAAKEKKWDLALQMIEAALQGAGAETQSRITILDTRVAVYLRMDKPDLALKDAKAMIRNDRTDGRGYIRCGQIEIGRGNATVAASFYEYGLKRVSTSSQHFETISTALSNVQEQIRIATMNSKPADPMQILPMEIVETVLSYVTYRQHVRMLRVCRAWNKLLRGLRPLTDTLAFPKPSRGITSMMVHAALRRLKCPTAVYIKGLDESASKTLADRMQCWQNIQNLSVLEVQDSAFTSWKLPLSKCGLTSVKFGPSVMTSILDVRDILRDCPGLGTAQFENVVSVGGGRMDDLVLEGGKLQHLVLVSAGSLWCNPEKLFSRLLRLQTLFLVGIKSETCFDLRHMEQLESLKMDRAVMTSVCLPPSLKALTFYRTNAHSVDSGNPFPETHLPILESLSMASCGDIPYLLPGRVVVEKLSRLTWIAEGRSASVWSSVLKRLLEQGRLGGVRQLHLKLRDVDDNLISGFIRDLPILEELCLDQAMITGVPISNLIKGNNKIRKISLIECPKVSGDIVPWARQRGVDIELVRQRTENGRRVREAE
ncbi:hypothetical protein LTR99_010189 [Exophiala xenobiotica]|uniref:F-box domain-containing protein n=1 Tax=Vermiconidia calcicola TaxID=1690605 RepID=A0AAV9PYA7_9PEZI|nr:hypothetical protein H2202_009007 [Exophiala xenobiotica]KAK5529405.1 hypothetical protein LTR25_009651 [Vermiconidia calcicola]KAK5537990.1 hypothetical protein LTR23_007284 [Chaetothyriales sp. CCFEE 6169]KAK5204254.1 hypothetical protein LTR41_009988 [Exophiala xenobiotica]KAK5293262.1 hypothetical protein LTR99_010189 [Exophiala xenobiotica]